MGERNHAGQLMDKSVVRESSWWINITRDAFTAEIATRFALNKAEKGHGGVQKFSTSEASARGGRKTRSTRGLRWGKKVREQEKKSA